MICALGGPAVGEWERTGTRVLGWVEQGIQKSGPPQHHYSVEEEEEAVGSIGYKQGEMLFHNLLFGPTI